MVLPSLDARLKTAFDLFPKCNIGADIGCDHGLLSLHLLASNKCNKILLTDISSSALNKGRKLLRKHNLDARAKFLLGDGLNALYGKVDCICILGMGGNTISHILYANPQRLHDAQLILSSHNYTHKLRKAIVDIGYQIDKEQVVSVKNRFYVLLRAQPGNIKYTEKELFLGPKLLNNSKRENILPYWAWQLKVYTKALKGKRQGSVFDENNMLFLKYIQYLKEELK